MPDPIWIQTDSAVSRGGRCCVLARQSRRGVLDLWPTDASVIAQIALPHATRDQARGCTDPFWSRPFHHVRGRTMRFRLTCLMLAVSFLPVAAKAQLTIDMASITCGQYLAMPAGQSRDFSAWMSGWFSYQLGKTSIDLATHEKNIANVQAWCRYHPQETVMSGLKNATGQ